MGDEEKAERDAIEQEATDLKRRLDALEKEKRHMRRERKERHRKKRVLEQEVKSKMSEIHAQLHVTQQYEAQSAVRKEEMLALASKLYAFVWFWFWFWF